MRDTESKWDDCVFGYLSDTTKDKNTAKERVALVIVGADIGSDSLDRMLSPRWALLISQRAGLTVVWLGFFAAGSVAGAAGAADIATRHRALSQKWALIWEPLFTVLCRLHLNVVVRSAPLTIFCSGSSGRPFVCCSF